MTSNPYLLSGNGHTKEAGCPVVGKEVTLGAVQSIQNWAARQAELERSLSTGRFI